MKIWQFVCGSVLVLSMTSCGDKTATTPPTETTPVAETAPTTPEVAASSAPSETPPVTQASPATSTATAADFPALKASISGTKKAGEAANFEAARTEFDKFGEAWTTVGEKVKSKSSTDFDEIEATIEEANMGINTEDKKRLLTNLTKLSGSIAKVSK